MASAGNSKPRNLFWSNGKESYQSRRMQNPVHRLPCRPRNKKVTVSSNKCPPILLHKDLTTKESNITLKHLCERDKQHVRQLILELAAAGQEKDTAEKALGRERGRFREALIQLNQQMVSLERENNHLQCQLNSFQAEPNHTSHHRIPDSSHLSSSDNGVSELQQSHCSPPPSTDSDWIPLPPLPSLPHKEQSTVVLNSRGLSSREDEEVNICVPVLQHHPASEEHPPAQEVSTGCETMSLQEVAPTNTVRSDSQKMMEACVQTEADICVNSVVGVTRDRCEVGTQTLEVEGSSTQTKSSSFATVQTTAPILAATTPVIGDISNMSCDSSVRLVESDDSNYAERDDCSTTREPMTTAGEPMTTAVYINTPSGLDVASKQQETTESVSSEEELSEEVEIAAVLLNSVEWDEGGQYGNCRSPQLQDDPLSLLDIAASLNHHSSISLPPVLSQTLSTTYMYLRFPNRCDSDCSNDEGGVAGEENDIIGDLFFQNT